MTPAMNCQLHSHVEYPASLHQRVEYIEYHGHHYDAQRHLATRAEQQRKYERPLQVVCLEQYEHDQRRGLKATVRPPPQRGHGEEYGSLHEHPAQTVVDGRTPAAGVHHAVACVDKVQGHEDCHRHKCHGGKKYVERQGSDFKHL